MANFPGLILTDAGRQLQAKAQIGQELQFSRVALGNGADPESPEALTALVAEKKSLAIQAMEVIGDGTSKIRAMLTNTGLAEGFFVTEIGIFAIDPDAAEEQLYAYSNSDEQSDFLPAEGGATVVEQIFDLVTVIGNATNVTAVIDDYIAIATQGWVMEQLASSSGALAITIASAEQTLTNKTLGDGTDFATDALARIQAAALAF